MTGSAFSSWTFWMIPVGCSRGGVRGGEGTGLDRELGWRIAPKMEVLHGRCHFFWLSEGVVFGSFFGVDFGSILRSILESFWSRFWSRFWSLFGLVFAGFLDRFCMVF